MKSSLRRTLMILCIMHASIFANDTTSENNLSIEKPTGHQVTPLAPAPQNTAAINEQHQKNASISTEKNSPKNTKKNIQLKKVASSAAGALNEAVESAVPWRVGSWIIDQSLRACKYTRTKSMQLIKSCVGKFNATRFFKSACKATGILLVVVFIYNFWTKLVSDDEPIEEIHAQKNAPALQSAVPAH